jgi:hypothetical protein
MGRVLLQDSSAASRCDPQRHSAKHRRKCEFQVVKADRKVAIAERFQYGDLFSLRRYQTRDASVISPAAFIVIPPLSFTFAALTNRFAAFFTNKQQLFPRHQVMIENC